MTPAICQAFCSAYAYAGTECKRCILYRVRCSKIRPEFDLSSRVSSVSNECEFLGSSRQPERPQIQTLFEFYLPGYCGNIVTATSGHGQPSTNCNSPCGESSLLLPHLSQLESSQIDAELLPLRSLAGDSTQNCGTSEEFALLFVVEPSSFRRDSKISFVRSSLTLLYVPSPPGGSYAITLYTKTPPSWSSPRCVTDGASRLLNAYCSSFVLCSSDFLKR